MEVMISSVLLAIIVIGTLTALDSSNRFSANAQDRSQANTLAQQDQDRLRGLQVSQLASLNSTRNVTLNGTTFTIASTGQFQSDATSTSSCGAGGTADYIKTSSTVTWPGMGTTPPVVATSIVTPPAGGSLIVQVIDSRGNGVPNMTVSGSGQATLSGTTGPDGCAIFGGLDGGSYNISVSQTGYVDKDGNTTPPLSQQAVTVIPGSSATKTFYFDLAGQIQVHFTSVQYGTTNNDVTGDTLAILNNNMTYPGVRFFGTVGSPDTPPIVASNVFPFQSAYTVFGGSCAGNQPSTLPGSNADPTVTVPQGLIVAFPGATPTPARLAIPLPSLNVTVYSGASTLSPGSVQANARVVITDVTNGCATQAKRAYTTNAKGQLANPSLPFGNYTVCADAAIGTQHRFVSWAGANTNPNGTPVNLYLQSSNASSPYTNSAQGYCP